MTWQQGGAYALLGPSGCGKTTLLNLISGIVRRRAARSCSTASTSHRCRPRSANRAGVPVSGDLRHHDGRTKPGLPAEEPRRAEGRRSTRGSRDRRLLDLAPYLAQGDAADRRRQAEDSLGRGLVRSDVAAVLFDEPLTVIDPEVKWQLRSKLKALHRELDLTMIYVTHDQTEALTFADTVVVMHDGRVVQSGPPAELFEQAGPHLRRLFHRLARHEHRARRGARPRGADRRPHHPARSATMRLAGGRQIEIGVRPEFVDVAAPGVRPAVGHYRAHRRSRPHPVRAGARRRAKFAARVPPGFSDPGNAAGAAVRSVARSCLRRQPAGRGR